MVKYGSMFAVFGVLYLVMPNRRPNPRALFVSAVFAGIALGFVFRTFAELTQIIADMLLPQ